MRDRFRIAPIVLAGCLALLAPEYVAGQDGSAAWRSDVDTLLALLRRVHPNPYRIHTPEQFDSAATALKARMPGLSPARAALELQGFLALAADGHTEWAVLPPQLRGAYLPIIFRRFEEGWFVPTADTTLRSLFGKPIVRLAGHPINDAVASVLPYVAGENPVGKLDEAADLLRNVRVLEALDLVGDARRSVDVTVRERDGSETTVSVPVTDASWVRPGWGDVDALVSPQAPEPLSSSLDGNYACAFLSDQRSVYVMFSETRDEDDGPTIAAFFDSAYAFARRAAADRLILDLRENSGGNLDLVGPVIRGVIASPALDRPGHFFVLIGPDTYSAAMHLAVQLERYTHAMFVGAPTGATPNHFGDTRVFTLPVSKVEVEISELYWQNSDPRDSRPWITPDVTVAPSAADYLVGRDAALDAALIFAADSGIIQTFGPPTTRWRRASQLLDARWPALLGEASGIVERRDPPAPHTIEACE